MKRTLSFSFSMVLLSVAVAPCGGPTPASAATLAHNRASCLSSDVSGDDAVIACTVAIKRNPKDAKLFVQRGIAWNTTGDYDYAIGDFSKAIGLDPRNAEAFYHRGIARERKGQLQESLVDLERYAELNPTDPGAQTAIVRVTAALAAKAAPQTLSDAVDEPHVVASASQEESPSEPKQIAPKTLSSASDEVLLFILTLLSVVGVAAIALLISKVCNRTSDGQ